MLQWKYLVRNEHLFTKIFSMNRGSYHRVGHLSASERHVSIFYILLFISTILDPFLSLFIHFHILRLEVIRIWTQHLWVKCVNQTTIGYDIPLTGNQGWPKSSPSAGVMTASWSIVAKTAEVPTISNNNFWLQKIHNSTAERFPKSQQTIENM